MKIDLSIEKIENCYILELNGKKFSCKSPNEIARRIMMELNPECIPMKYRQALKLTQGEKMSLFFNDKVGHLQKKILEEFKKKKLITVAEITDKLYPKYRKSNPDLYKSGLYLHVNKAFVSLARKGLIEKTNLGSSAKHWRLKI